MGHCSRHIGLALCDLCNYLPEEISVPVFTITPYRPQFLLDYFKTAAKIPSRPEKLTVLGLV